MDVQKIINTLMDARAVANVALHRSGYVPGHVEQEIRKLSNLKLAIGKQKALHDALTAPWRRLPFEILSTIFIHALPEDWSVQPAGKRTLNCMSVCILWHDIAVQTPQLWTSLCFDRDSNPLANHMHALTTELRKSGKLPLEVSMNFLDDEKKWSYEAWALLCAESHRWQRISLRHLPEAAYERLSDREFPALQALSIGQEDASLADSCLRVFDQESCQPSALSIAGTGIHCLGLALPSSWPITELDLDLTTTELTEWAAVRGVIIAYSATLRTCRICSELDDDLRVDRWETPIDLPCLETLILDSESVQICQVVACVNLQSLTLCGSATPADDVLDALKDLLDNSSECKLLRSLTLRQLDRVCINYLFRCLDLLPWLTSLELDNNIGDSAHGRLLSLDVLRQLERTPARPGSMTLLPNLETLSLSFGDASYDEGESEYVLAIKDIADSRTRPQTVGGIRLAPLKCLHTYGASVKLPSFERKGEKMHMLWPSTSVP